MSQDLNKSDSKRTGYLDRALSAIGLQRKAKPLPTPDLGQYNYSSSFPYRSFWGRRPDKVDHKSEVGSLDLNSLAMAVVNFTSIRIPEARPCVVTRNDEGDEERDFNHQVASLIRRPNRHHIWADYAGAVSMDWWFYGNVFLYKTRSLTAVEELWYLPRQRVRPRWPGDAGSPDVVRWANEHGEKESDLDPYLSHYEYTAPGKNPVLYPVKDILHLKRYVDPVEPRLGLGAFESLYKELYGDARMSLFTAAIFTNMGIQVPVISPKDDTQIISPEDAAQWKESWMQKTTGSRAGEPIIMMDPVSIEKFGFAPKDLDVSEQKLNIEARVCSVCQISPAALQLMVGVQNGTSYASSEQARQQGYEEVIIPIQSVWAENITWQLVREDNEKEQAEFEFDVSNVRVLQEDMDAKYKRETSLLAGGGQTINETRQSLGKKPVGPEGDVYLIPSLSSPTTPDQLIAKADGSLDPEPAPITPPDPATLAKFADFERMFEGLEKQMKNFMAER